MQEDGDKALLSYSRYPDEFFTALASFALYVVDLAASARLKAWKSSREGSVSKACSGNSR